MAWLLGVTTALVLAFVGAMIGGALVPGSKVAEANARADKSEAVVAAQKETIDTQRYTISEQKDHILVAQSGAVAADKLLNTMRAIVQQPQTGGEVG
jgi:hypothetical protein